MVAYRGIDLRRRLLLCAGAFLLGIIDWDSSCTSSSNRFSVAATHAATIGEDAVVEPFGAESVAGKGGGEAVRPRERARKPWEIVQLCS